MGGEGWIKLYRKLQDNPLWLSEPFTRGQAWVDLLFLANHAEGYIIVRGIRVPVFRGQVGWSIVRLSGRWKWSRTKTKNFLNLLEKEEQIKQQNNNESSIITILNYEEHQKESSKPDTKVDSRRAAEEQQKSTNKNEKKKKNEKNDIVRESKFEKLYTITNDFIPNSHEDALAKDIATELGEEYINFTLSVVKKHGIDIAQRAFTEVQESKAVQDKRKLFNHLIKKLADQNI